MPEDVLEQFLGDHGTSWHIQEQYGDLDLHALRWIRESVASDLLVGASVYRRFQRTVEEIATQVAAAATVGWRGANLSTKELSRWQTEGTWLRPPIMVAGDLAGSTAQLHLVEGHRRLGALTGLVRCGVMNAKALHSVWVGSSCPPATTNTWQRVVKEHPVSFVDWLLFDGHRDEAIAGVADEINLAEPQDDDFAALADAVLRGEARPELRSALTAAKEEWVRYTRK